MTVREIIARTTLESSGRGPCLAFVEIALCLTDGRRVQAREEDRLEFEVDTSNAISTRAAVTSAVRTFLRTALADGTAAGWPAFGALGRYGATWSPDDRETVQISVDVGEIAVAAA
jgi:hypothetical protein